GGGKELRVGGGQRWRVGVGGRPGPAVAEQPNVVTSVVGGDYFRALRIRLVDGRLFSPADGADLPAVILVSESMAKRFWPGESALHKRLTTAFLPGAREVVGIGGDLKVNGLEVREPVPEMYLPETQFPLRGMDLAIRTRTKSPAVAAATVEAVHSLDPDLPVLRIGTLDQIRTGSLSRQRFGWSSWRASP